MHTGTTILPDWLRTADSNAIKFASLRLVRRDIDIECSKIFSDDRPDIFDHRGFDCIDMPGRAIGWRDWQVERETRTPVISTIQPVVNTVSVEIQINGVPGPGIALQMRNRILRECLTKFQWNAATKLITGLGGYTRQVKL